MKRVAIICFSMMLLFGVFSGLYAAGQIEEGTQEEVFVIGRSNGRNNP